MVPGLAFLYAGLARRKNALALVWAVIFSNAVATFVWYLWGYSLAFSPTAKNGFIGDLHNAFLNNLPGAASPGSPLIPDLLYSFFQLEFCAVTVGILMGAVAERGRVMPAMVFSFFWITLVYSPVACWAWSTNGWASKWGVLDYAGGGPVEIGSGIGGLAYSWVLGRRHPRELVNFRPHNVTLVALGTFMLWFGWIGFNAGSAFGANMRAIYAAWNTCMAGAISGITWCLVRFRGPSNPKPASNSPTSLISVCKGSTPQSVSAPVLSPVSSLRPPRLASSPSGHRSSSASSPALYATTARRSSTGSASTTRSISSPSTQLAASSASSSTASSPRAKSLLWMVSALASKGAGSTTTGSSSISNSDTYARAAPTSSSSLRCWP